MWNDDPDGLQGFTPFVLHMTQSPEWHKLVPLVSSPRKRLSRAEVTDRTAVIPETTLFCIRSCGLKTIYIIYLGILLGGDGGNTRKFLALEQFQTDTSMSDDVEKMGEI